MPKKIIIKAGPVQGRAYLNETGIAQAIWDSLPITGRANTWGDEIYFSIPVVKENENPKETVQMGDLGYWPSGHAFCIFFGPTPMSSGDEIRPASPVTIIGRLEEGPEEFGKVSSGSDIRIEKEGE